MSAEIIREITDGLAKVIGTDSGFGAILKFDYEGAGVTRIDGKNVPNSVSNEDGPADCTITISADNLMKMFKRELDPTMAFMQGKMKVAGDMSVAMKLGPILQKAAGV
jgi:putative sterol carrier protein